MNGKKMYNPDGTEFTREQYYHLNWERMNKNRRMFTTATLYTLISTAFLWILNIAVSVFMLIAVAYGNFLSYKILERFDGDALNRAMGNVWSFLIFIGLIPLFIFSLLTFIKLKRKYCNITMYISLGEFLVTAISLVVSPSWISVFFLLHAIAGMFVSWFCSHCIDVIDELSNYDGFPHFNALIDCHYGSRYFRAIATKYTPTAFGGVVNEEPPKKKKISLVKTAEHHGERLTKKHDNGAMDEIDLSNLRSSDRE